MVQYLSGPDIAGFYNTVGASTTGTFSATQGSATGAKGDYLDSLTIVASAAPGVFTLLDGGTTVMTYTPAANSASNLFIRAYSKVGAWNVSTGATTNVVAVGKFT